MQLSTESSTTGSFTEASWRTANVARSLVVGQTNRLAAVPLDARQTSLPFRVDHSPETRTARRLGDISGTDTGSLASIIPQRRNVILRPIREHRGADLSHHVVGRENAFACRDQHLDQTVGGERGRCHA